MGEYREKLLGLDQPVGLIGTLRAHTWRDTVTLQFHVTDIVC